MRQLPYLFIMIAFILMSCKSSNESLNGTDAINNIETTAEAESSDQETKRQAMTGRELVGQWEWVKTSCCGRMTRDIFPEEGAEKKIISFSKDGMSEYYIGDNGTKLTEQGFSIGKMGTQSTVRIGELQPALFYVKDDELSLSWGYIDLQIEYYKRIK